MGLIRAAVGAVGGTLSDSWLDYIRAENMTPTTILTKGEQVGKQHRRGSADIISNGSRIEVGANQMLFLTEGGKIVNYTAEQGYYEVFMSQSPSLFNGELKASVKETFERFKFGGQPGKSQRAYFVNLSEIRGIRFGTRNVFRTVLKPTPSIYKEQHTVDYISRQDAELQIRGRHDPCIVPRAAVVQNTLTAFGLLDLLTVRYGTLAQKHGLPQV